MVGKYNSLIILRIIIEVMTPTIFVIFYDVLYFMQMQFHIAFNYFLTIPKYVLQKKRKRKKE